MHQRIRIFAFVLFFLASVSFAAERRPNVLILLADDLGYADVGFQGCKDIPTPNIDSLAKNGVRCSSGYVSGPYCSPTRAGLLTGRYQTRFGHEFNPAGAGENIGLPLTEVTLPDRLKKAGYKTGWVGKWHLGSANKFHPMNRGFDETYGFLGGAHAYLAEKGKLIMLRGLKEVDEKEYLTDAFAREAVEFIDRNQKEPFFLYLAFNAVHTPMHATEKYLKRFPNLSGQRKIYAAMHSAMDDNIGLVLQKLRDCKIEEETLIYFFSDNGGPTMQGTTINASVNAPLRGSKRQTLEGGIRVPFVVQWKGKLPAGKTYDQPVIQLDLHATALAVAGLTVDKDAKQLDGVNLLPYLEGKNMEAPHDALYWRFGEQMAIRKGDWKLVQYDNSSRKLYNLAKDIGESDDLSKKEPEKFKELEEQWQKWNKELVPPLWGAGKKK